MLEEPSLEDDYEAWATWYGGIKAHRERLEERLQALGVRALPAAAKGSGWTEDTAAPAPARPSDCMTLHGQRGGGI